MSLRRLLLSAACILCLTTATHAAGAFLLPTDTRLREDVRLLVDEGVLHLPSNAWPLPTADVARAVSRIDVGVLHEAALQSALLRVRARVTPQASDEAWRLRELRVTAGEESLLRDDATLGRDSLEVQVTGGARSGRWSVTAALTAVASPDDGQAVRFDGTDATLRFGNWLFSANQLPRWWGPGRDGGLILSTNARPMPGVSVDRAESLPIDFPVLRWLGPWRFTGFLAAQEGSRPDVDHSLFMGMRLSFKPAQILELGLSRSAQFCGSGRPCDLKAFWNVLAGRDNAGMRVAPEDEPGNQMAGADLRLVSPWRSLPVAAYAELIGEDGSSTGIPERYLGLLGLEGWWMRDNGDVLRMRVEYANTSCKFYSSGENPNCAYRQGIFNAGYRFRGRNIGHTTDADAESTGVTFSYARSGGDTWTLQLRRATLDRYGPPDIYNPLSFGESDYHSARLGWSGRLLGQDLSIQFGGERHEGADGRGDTQPFGFVQWRRSL